MIRLCLIVLGWPLLVVLLITGYEWYRAETAPPPWLTPPGTPVDYSVVRQVTATALEAFGRLSPGEQEAVITIVDRALMPPGAWIEQVRAADYRILCIGETHRTATRTFLAETFFSRYPVDTLLLETHPEDLKRMRRRIREGDVYVPLLDADIGGILRSARLRNPAIRIVGIEETREQSRLRHRYEGSRDRSLARNVWSHYRPGDRHVVLYGALHCADERGWLYRHLRTQSPPRDAVSMYSVRVLGENEFAPLAAFIGFLDGIGIADDDFVIARPDLLHPRIRQWFGLLDQYVLRQYDALVVFRRTPDWPPRPAIAIDAGGVGDGLHLRPGPRTIRTGSAR